MCTMTKAVVNEESLVITQQPQMHQRHRRRRSAPTLSLLSPVHPDNSHFAASTKKKQKKRILVWMASLCFVEFVVLHGYYHHKHTRLLPSVVSHEKSFDFVSQLGISKCRFSSFYDANFFHFNFRNGNSYVSLDGYWRHAQKALRGDEDGDSDAKRVDALIRHRQHTRKRDEHRDPTLQPVTRNLTLVHVGKAGGSSISCNLRTARQYTEDHCDNMDTDVSSSSHEKGHPYVRESAISRHVSCYTHWNMNLKCYYIENNSFLMNLRNPLDRIASWFVYEHTENHGAVYNDRHWHCGQLVLNGACYRTFEDLTTLGLRGTAPPHPEQPLRVGTNLTDTECTHWAWATVQGNVPADYHNSWNYDWYAHRVLLENNQHSSSELFVLRVEHLAQDWSKIDTMLGGTGETPTSLEKSQNSAATKELRISHHNTTRAGIRNLCRALCPEIQVYKRLLLKAVNLSPDDLEVSALELRQMCPEETSIQPRECHYDYN